MDSIDITTNYFDYVKVIERYGRARKKTHAEVITRLAQQANFRCVASERKGGVKRADLTQFPVNAGAAPEKQKKGYKGRFWYAHQAKRGVKKGKGGDIVMRPKAQAAWARRRSAKGAMAAGFLMSAKRLGLKKKGAKSLQPKPGGSASKSSGIKASVGLKMRATSVNAVEGSFEVGRYYMDKAIAAQLTDMDQFVDELQKTNNQFQPKK